MVVVVVVVGLTESGGGSGGCGADSATKDDTIDQEKCQSAPK